MSSSLILREEAAEGTTRTFSFSGLRIVLGEKVRGQACESGMKKGWELRFQVVLRYVPCRLDLHQLKRTDSEAARVRSRVLGPNGSLVRRGWRYTGVNHYEALGGTTRDAKV